MASVRRMRLRGASRCKVGLDRRGSNRGLVLDAGEIFFFVAMHLQGGKKFRVVVLHRKAEMRSLVVLDHFGIVATVDSSRARHSAGAVVVRGNRQRPITKSVV